MTRSIVAVDGVVGAGKSTVCRMAGKILGWPAVSTGVFYRTVAFIVQQHGVALHAEQQLQQLLTRELPTVRWELTTSGEVYYGGEQLTVQLETEQLGDAASVLSELQVVRALLLPLQREVVSACPQQGVIVDGRDIGTVVFPHADLKIFMVASLEQRARRRAGDTDTDIQTLRRRIVERDRRDSSRALAPLKKAHAAVELDTSRLTIDQAAERMVILIREHLLSATT